MRVFGFALCLVPLLVAGCVAQGDAGQCTSPPAKRAYFETPVAEQTMDEILANIVLCLPNDRADVRAANIGAQAGEDVQFMLAALYRNDEPDAEILRALGDNLNVLLRPTEDRFAHSTLLNEAVRQQNYRWVRALLTAGADPNGSGSLMAYTATSDISHPKSPWNHLYRDGSPSVPFLQAYLDHGGDVNTTKEGGFGDIPLLNRSFNNLAARVFLLENGADGWRHQGQPHRLQFTTTAFGGRISGARAADFNEEMYLLVQRGLFQMPQEPIYADLVHQTYLDVLEEMADASGPTGRHTLWTLQKVLGAMIEKGHLTPSDDMRNLLQSNAVSDAEGGWVLSRDMLHQAFDDPRSGAVLGTEVW